MMYTTAAASLMLNLCGGLNANKAKLNWNIIFQHIPAIRLKASNQNSAQLYFKKSIFLSLFDMKAVASNNIMDQKNIMGDRKLVNPNHNHLLKAEHMQQSGTWVLNLTFPTVDMQR